MKTKLTILLILSLITSAVYTQTPRSSLSRIDKMKTEGLFEKKKISYNPICATLVSPGGKHYFFTEDRYFRYSSDDGVEKIANTKTNWPGIPDNMDAAFVNPKNDKAYFFKGSKYYRWDFKNGLENNALSISRYWKGVPNNVDAVVSHPNGNIYFFKGSKYFRYDPTTKKVDNEALISKYWKGVPNNVDAVLIHPTNGKIYFFKGTTYYRYDITGGKVDWTKTIGQVGWKGLDFNKKNFTKKINSNATSSSKDNIRLKVTLTRIKSIQARDSDDIADLLINQVVGYTTKGNQKLAIKKTIKVGSNEINTDDEYSSIISTGDYSSGHMHVKEGDENHFINNSLVYEIDHQEMVDKRAEFKLKTTLEEVTGGGWGLYHKNKFKKIARYGDNDMEVSIYEVLEYLQDPTNSKYGGKYFKGGKNGKYHEYGAFGDVMWFKKGSHNSLEGFIEFGNNNKETYVRLYYRFELVP